MVDIRMEANEELFNRFRAMSHKVGNLGGIVQNPNTLTSITELLEYNQHFNDVIRELKQLLKDVNDVAKPV